MRLKTKFINKIGVEMEGAFLYKPRFPRIKRDGSVNISFNKLVIEERGLRLYLSSGEINSRPYKNIVSLQNWIQKHFPRFSNSTCGFHVHVSFRDLMFKAALTNQDFHDRFIEDLNTWLESKRISTPFKSRLKGNNYYCRIGFNRWDKYRAINFASRYGTIEFRIFSQVMSSELAQECVEWLHNYIEYYLDVKFAK